MSIQTEHNEKISVLKKAVKYSCSVITYFKKAKLKSFNAPNVALRPVCPCVF